jgi:hypothetical protein
MPLCALASTLHDPSGLLAAQIGRAMPLLQPLFSGIVVRATAVTHANALAALASSGALVEQAESDKERTGESRRAALAMALGMSRGHILYCDLDRALHWVERYPQELAGMLEDIQEQDFTVLGRTPRAWLTHPRSQRDTEAIINTVFARVSGHAWDVGAGARGLSRRAAEGVHVGCPDPDMSNDATWPLYLLREGGFSVGYLEADGLEFETGDRYGEEVARAGGLDAWLRARDDDPKLWLYRLYVARTEIQAMIPFAAEDERDTR